MADNRNRFPRVRVRHHIAFESRGWRWNVSTETDDSGVELHVQMYRDVGFRSGCMSDERELTVIRKSFGRCLAVANGQLLLNAFERQQLSKLGMDAKAKGRVTNV